MLTYDVVVIGGGPGGLAAAIEAKENGIDNILIIERDRELGGILQQCIHNGFGLKEFNEELTGPEYGERFIKKVYDLNIDIKPDTMVVDITKDKVITALNNISGYFNIKAKSIILSMGCRERTRGAIDIPGTRPSGIFTAGTAQRYINIEGYMVGKKVFILGSGDIGLIMARRLTLEGAEVIGVGEIMPYSAGLKRNISQCLDDYNIPLMLSHTVIDIRGKSRLEEIVIAEVDNNKRPIEGTLKHLNCDTLILSVGLIPENELSLNAGIKIDNKTGGPIVNQYMETSIDGIFACGNVVSVQDIVDYVSLQGRRAAKGVVKFIKGKNKKSKVINYTIGSKGINYVVPQIIDMSNLEETLELSLRVKKPYRNVSLLVKNNEKLIKKIDKEIIVPSEMEKVILLTKEINPNHPIILEIYGEGDDIE